MSEDQNAKQNQVSKALATEILKGTPEDEYLPAESSRVAIVRFASESVTKLFVGLTPSTQTVHNALGGEKLDGSTATHTAIDLAREHLVSDSRTTAEKVIVLLTDGQPTNPELATRAADHAKRLGIRLFCVSVGVLPWAEAKLKTLASLPDHAHYMKAESFDALFAVMEQILGRLRGLYTIDILEFRPGTLPEGCRIPVLVSNKAFINHQGRVTLEITSQDLFKPFVAQMPDGWQEQEVDVNLVPRQGVTAEKISQQGARLNFSLYVNGKLVYSCYYKFSFPLVNGGFSLIEKNKKMYRDAK